MYPMTNHEPRRAGPDSALLMRPEHRFVHWLYSALRGAAVKCWKCSPESEGGTGRSCKHTQAHTAAALSSAGEREAELDSVRGAAPETGTWARPQRVAGAGGGPARATVLCKGRQWPSAAGRQWAGTAWGGRSRMVTQGRQVWVEEPGRNQWGVLSPKGKYRV